MKLGTLVFNLLITVVGCLIALALFVFVIIPKVIEGVLSKLSMSEPSPKPRGEFIDAEWSDAK